MENFFDPETAEMKAGNRRALAASEQPRLILKRKTAYPTPEFFVNREGFYRKEGSANHLNSTQTATIAGVANSVVPGSGVVLTTLANLFGKKPVGDKGWQSFIQQNPRPVGSQYYPSLQQILNANFITDAKQLAAIKQTYDQNTGMGTEGDFHFAVTSTTPITIDWYKGDSEHFTTKSNVNAATAPIQVSAPVSQIPTANVQPVQAPAVSLLSGQSAVAKATGASAPAATPTASDMSKALGASVASVSLKNPVVMVVIGGIVLLAAWMIVKKM